MADTTSGCGALALQPLFFWGGDAIGLTLVRAIESARVGTIGRWRMLVQRFGPVFRMPRGGRGCEG